MPNHLESADLRQDESGADPYPGDLQNVPGTSLSKDRSMIKFSCRSDQFVQRFEPNYVKMPHLVVLKNPSLAVWRSG